MAEYDGTALTMGDRAIPLTPDEAEDASRAILDWQVAQTKAWEQQQRAAGQVWLAHYMRHHVEYQDECFTAEDAKGRLYYGSENGDLAPIDVICPDGSRITWDEINDELYAREKAERDARIAARMEP